MLGMVPGPDLHPRSGKRRADHHRGAQVRPAGARGGRQRAAGDAHARGARRLRPKIFRDRGTSIRRSKSSSERGAAEFPPHFAPHPPHLAPDDGAVHAARRLRQDGVMRRSFSRTRIRATQRERTQDKADGMSGRSSVERLPSGRRDDDRRIRDGRRVPPESHLSHLIPLNPGESRMDLCSRASRGMPAGAGRGQSTSNSLLATVQPITASAPSARSG